MTEARLTVFTNTFSEEHCISKGQGWGRSFCHGPSWQYRTKVKIPIGLATRLETLTACGHGSASAAMGQPLPFHGKSGFAAAMQLDLGAQVGWLCCAVSWLSVPRYCGAQNQAERVETSFTADVAAGENKSACLLTRTELVEYLLKDMGAQSSDDLSREAVVFSHHTRDMLGSTGRKEAAGGTFCHRSDGCLGQVCWVSFGLSTMKH